MITAKFKDFTDYKKLKQDADKSAKKALYSLGGFVTMSAKSFIRSRKKPSKPGQPYSRQTGFMKNSIITIRDDRTVITKYFRGQTLGAVHEFGGKNPLNNNQYPERSVFAPALEKAIKDFNKKFPEEFQRYFGKTLS